jgi:hypothetical protein
VSGVVRLEQPTYTEEIKGEVIVTVKALRLTDIARKSSTLFAKQMKTKSSLSGPTIVVVGRMSSPKER